MLPSLNPRAHSHHPYLPSSPPFPHCLHRFISCPRLPPPNLISPWNPIKNSRSAYLRPAEAFKLRLRLITIDLTPSAAFHGLLFAFPLPQRRTDAQPPPRPHPQSTQTQPQQPSPANSHTTTATRARATAPGTATALSACLLKRRKLLARTTARTEQQP